MANATPSRPGVNQTAGKMETNIQVGEEVVRKADGNVVLRTEYDSGTIRETNIFAGDNEDAPDYVKPQAEREADAKFRADVRAEIIAQIKAEEDAKTLSVAAAARNLSKPKSRRAAKTGGITKAAQAIVDAAADDEVDK